MSASYFTYYNVHAVEYDLRKDIYAVTGQSLWAAEKHAQRRVEEDRIVSAILGWGAAWVVGLIGVLPWTL